MMIRGTQTLLLLIALISPIMGQPAGRNLKDQPDEKGSEPHIHVIYTLARDGKDEGWDVTGMIERSVEAAQKWLKDETGGPQLRLDTYLGKLDVTFFRLSRTDKELSNAQDLAVQIENELWAGDFNEADKLYVAYYGGDLTDCAQAPRPENGRIAVIAPNSRNCDGPFKGDGTLDEWEYTLVHEIFHLLGAVSPQAPHIDSKDPQKSSNHTRDLCDDLMGREWGPDRLYLDIGKDDYYGHGRSFVDVARSVFLEPLPAGPKYPEPWPLVSLPQLTPNQCSASPPGRVPAKIQIVNASQSSIEVCWIDDRGNPKDCQRVGSFGMSERSSWEGHCLSIRRPGGAKALAAFRVQKPFGRGVYRASPP